MRSLSCVAVSLLCGAVLGACQGGVRSGALEEGRAKSALTPGWHLLTTSSAEQAARVRAVVEEGGRLFEVGPSWHDADSPKNSPTSAGADARQRHVAVSGKVYWVYVGREDTTTKALRPPSFEAWGSENGYFVQPSVPVAARFLDDGAVFQWDSTAQQARVLVSAETLQVGEVYWVKRSWACGAGAWGFEDALGLAERCGSTPKPVSMVSIQGEEAFAPERLEHISDLALSSELTASVTADQTAPLLYVGLPSTVRFQTHPSFLLRGVLYDESEAELLLNGVVVAKGNQSFEHTLWLDDGPNVLRLLARDEAGNVSRFETQIVVDRTAPEIEVQGLGERASEDHMFVTGQVREGNLKSLTLNGVPVSLHGDAFQIPVDVRALALGFHPFSFWAIDEAGHTAERNVALYVDEQGATLVSGAPAPKAEAVGSSFGQGHAGFYLDISASVPDTDFGVRVQDEDGGEAWLDAASLLGQTIDDRWYRGCVYGSELDLVNTHQIAKIEVTVVKPEGSELTWSVVPFAQETAPCWSAGYDIMFPRLEVTAPAAPVSYTNVPRVVVRGQAADEHLRFVSIDRVITSTVGGAFESFVELRGGANVLRIAAQDMADHVTKLERTVIYDPDPPRLSLTRAPQETVYTAEYTLGGKVHDRYLKQLVLKNLDSQEEEVVKTESGNFSLPISLKVGLNRFTLTAADRANNVGSVGLMLSYEPGSYVPSLATLPPTRLEAWTREGRVHLQWTPPEKLADGSWIPNGVKPDFRIYRGGTAIEDTASPSYVGEPPASHQAQRYFVTSVLKWPGGEVESPRSSIVELVVGRDEPVASPGGFSVASDVTRGRQRVAVPEVSFGAYGGTPYTHLVYLVRGTETTPDEVRYTRSSQFAKADSWTTAQLIKSAEGSWGISEVSVSARNGKLIVGWIEQKRDGQESRVQMVESGRAGEVGSFSSEKTVRNNTRWKRNLDMAFDRFDQHHMIWSEANKVFYLKDFEGEVARQGEPVNVFDQRKRRINYEQINYQQVHKSKTCESECCWDQYDDAYSLGHEVDPVSGQPIGPYLERTEETFVENPSLHVDSEKVTIIARQTRMFDNFPYRNPDWQGEAQAFFGPLVGAPRWVGTALDGSWCPLEGSVRYQMGFQWAQAKSPYACLPKVPVDVEALLGADADHARTEHWAKEDFYAYDGRRGHPLSWYQRTVEGQWFEDDHIKVAQRPLQPRVWSRENTVLRVVPRIVDAKLVLSEVEEVVEEGWREGAWSRGPFTKESVPKGRLQFEEVFQNWRISNVDTFPCERRGDYTRCQEGENAPSGAVGPSYASVYTAPDGRMVAAYEKGTATDPNQLGNNPIFFASSEDGGVHWSVLQDPVARGYMPSLGVAARGEIAVLYYEPEPESSAPGRGRRVGRVMVARSKDGRTFDHESLGMGFHQETTERSVVFAEPIHPSVYGQAADVYYGVPTLGTHEDLWLAAWVRAPEDAKGAPQIVTARATTSTVTQKQIVVTAPPVVTENQSFKATFECVDAYHALTTGCSTEKTKILSQNGTLRSLDHLVGGGEKTLNGRKEVWLGGTTQNAPLYTQVVRSSKALAANAGPLPIGSEVSLAVGTAIPNEETLLAGSLAKAVDKNVVVVQPGKIIQGDVHGNHRRAQIIRDALYVPGIQREYQEVIGDRDSEFLALYGRAWAYTQGIALAQYARHDDDRAFALADTLCRTAVASADGTHLMGWPFSRNTDGDGWRDARLVTGANAWALHGLGVFLSSDRFRSIPEAEKRRYADCYGRTLVGLSHHRASDLGDASLARWLMTAGTTTEGLQFASKPSTLGLTSDPAREFAYYDVLDVIGYDDFRPDLSPRIRTFYRDDQGEWLEETFEELLLGEGDIHLFNRLRVPAVAKNVVTEHNLDTLSVLNHALHNWGSFSSFLPESVGVELGGIEGLTAWRDGLRGAIFTELWREDEGRIVTGGEVHDQEFVASDNTAIDNCSWLALSVDYDALSPAEKTKLARCLHYTIDHFVRPDLSFNHVLYRGAFYFPNSFKDPYVEASQHNESLYHLEATTGLILGLATFVDALGEEFPQDAARFEQEASALWGSMQAFVESNGAPYSTVRIHNLMTQLPSATAAIWFIDVYDYYEARQNHIDRPLKHYARGASTYHLASAEVSTEEAWERLKQSDHRHDENRQRGLPLGADEGGLAENVSTGRIISQTIAKDVSLPGACEATGGSCLPALQVTFLEDQALAILAALSVGDFESASAWADGLVSTVHEFEEAGVRYAQFPYAVDSSDGSALGAYYQTGAQMLAVYALTAYLRGPRGTNPRAKDDSTGALAWRMVQDVMTTLTSLYHRPGQSWMMSGGGDVDGVARALVNPYERPAHVTPNFDSMQPLFEIGALSDQIYAYFATDMVLAVAKQRGAEQEAWVGRLKAVQQDLVVALEEDFAKDGRLIPFIGAKAPPGGWGDRLDAHILDTFYRIHRADLNGARRTWDRVISIASAWGSEIFSSSRPGIGGSAAGLLLAKRAASAFDPRLEELALDDLRRLIEKSQRPRDWAGLILAADPRGFLGVDPGPLLGDGLPELRALAERSSSLDYSLVMNERLQEAYLDTLFSLLASEFRPYAFDALVRRLSLIEFVFGAVESGQKTDGWRAEYEALFDSTLLSTLGRLENLCRYGYPKLVEGASPSLGTGGLGSAPGSTGFVEYPLGLSCEDVSAQFARLLTRRIGSTRTEDLLPVLDHPHDALDMAQFTRQIHELGSEHGIYDRSEGAFFSEHLFLGRRYGSSLAPTRTHRSLRLLADGGPSSLPPIPGFPSDATAEQVSAALVARTSKILREALEEQQRYPERDVFYEFAGIDFIHMSNHASWDHMSREGLEFRAFKSVSIDPHFTLFGQSLLDSSASPDPLEAQDAESGLTYGQRKENVRQLRRLLNLEAQGDLTVAAALAGMSADELHRMMRTGKVRSSDFRALVDGLELSEEVTKTWAPLFTFPSTDSAVFAVETIVMPVDVFDLHRGRTDTLLAQAVPFPFGFDGVLPSFDDVGATTIHVLGSDRVQAPEGEERCYEVYRFNAADVPESYFRTQDLGLVSQSTLADARIASCFDGSGPFVDPGIGGAYLEALVEGSLYVSSYLVRQAWVPWPEGAMAGVYQLPVIPGEFESPVDAPLTGRALDLPTWVGKEGSPPELGQPELAVSVSEAGRVTVHFEEALSGCHQVIKVPTYGLAFSRLAFASESYLNGWEVASCFEGDEFQTTLSPLEFENRPWTFAFVPVELDLGQWPALLAAGHVILASTGGELPAPHFEKTTELDMAFFFTRRAIEAAAARRGIAPSEVPQKLAHEAVRETNQVMINSRVPVRVNLVHAGVTDFQEGPDIDKVHDSILDNPPSDMWEAYQDSKADLVSLQVHESQSSSELGSASAYLGVAKRLNWESPSIVHVSNWDHMVAPFSTVAHETGHNLGCVHDVLEPSTQEPLRPYAKAYRTNTINGLSKIGTLLSPLDTSLFDRLPVYSNPRLFVAGLRMGTEEGADCARTIMEAAPVVSRINGRVGWDSRLEIQGLELLDLDGQALEGDSPLLFIAESLNASSKSYLLSNPLGVPMTWHPFFIDVQEKGGFFGDVELDFLESSRAVVEVSPPGSTIGPGETVKITLSLNKRDLARREPGEYENLIRFGTIGGLQGHVGGGVGIIIKEGALESGVDALGQASGGRLSLGGVEDFTPFVLSRASVDDPDFEYCQHLRVHRAKDAVFGYEATVLGAITIAGKWLEVEVLNWLNGVDGSGVPEIAFCLNPDALRELPIGYGPTFAQVRLRFEDRFSDDSHEVVHTIELNLDEPVLSVRDATDGRLKVMPGETCRTIEVDNTGETQVEWTVRAEGGVVVADTSAELLEGYRRGDFEFCVRDEDAIKRGDGRLILENRNTGRTQAFGIFSLAPRLVGHWPLDGDARDHGPGGHHGEAPRAVAFRSGTQGQALEVGPGQPSIDIETGPDLRFDRTNEAFSITAWISPGDHREETRYILGNLNRGRGWALALTAANELAFILARGRNQMFQAVSPFNLDEAFRGSSENGTWTQIGVSWDGHGLIDWHHSGLETDPEPNPFGPAESMDIRTLAPIVLGGIPDESGTPFDGALDEVKIHRGLWPEAALSTLNHSASSLSVPILPVLAPTVQQDGCAAVDVRTGPEGNTELVCSTPGSGGVAIMGLVSKAVQTVKKPLLDTVRTRSPQLLQGEGATEGLFLGGVVVGGVGGLVDPTPNIVATSVAPQGRLWVWQGTSTVRAWLDHLASSEGLRLSRSPNLTENFRFMPSANYVIVFPFPVVPHTHLHTLSLIDEPYTPIDVYQYLDVPAPASEAAPLFEAETRWLSQFFEWSMAEPTAGGSRSDLAPSFQEVAPYEHFFDPATAHDMGMLQARLPSEIIDDAFLELGTPVVESVPEGYVIKYSDQVFDESVPVVGVYTRCSHKKKDLESLGPKDDYAIGGKEHQLFTFGLPLNPFDAFAYRGLVGHFNIWSNSPRTVHGVIPKHRLWCMSRRVYEKNGQLLFGAWSKIFSFETNANPDDIDVLELERANKGNSDDYRITVSVALSEALTAPSGVPLQVATALIYSLNDDGEPTDIKEVPAEWATPPETGHSKKRASVVIGPDAELFVGSKPRFVVVRLHSHAHSGHYIAAPVQVNP